MVLLKIIPLLIPLIILLIPIIAKSYLKFLFSNNKTNKDNLMFACDKCGTYCHQSIVIKKRDKNFCSSECASA
jgi:hypothetical protein